MKLILLKQVKENTWLLAPGLGGPCTEKKREERAPLGSWGRFAGASWRIETGGHLNTDENDPVGNQRGSRSWWRQEELDGKLRRKRSAELTHRSTAGGPSKEIRDEPRL